MSIPLSSSSPEASPQRALASEVAGGRPAAAPEAVPAPAGAYRRYHIATAEATDRVPLPPRFLVRVRRLRLARLILSEVVRYWGRWETVLNRPCVYGVFSGPVGGFSPRQQHCVGCLRCTIQHPDVVEVLGNPERQHLGDDYFGFQQVETVLQEASNGQVPVKGQGYRGRFGGSGWDAMWTDMSEIVRPTRDGIHGRETISTVVELGGAPSHVDLLGGRLAAPLPSSLRLQLPMLLDLPPAAGDAAVLAPIWARAAAELETLAVLPLSAVRAGGVDGASTLPWVMPLVDPSEAAALPSLTTPPRVVMLAGWDAGAFAALREALPEAVTAVRLPFAGGWRETLVAAAAAGARTFHLEADYHGRGQGGEFVLDLVMEAHRLLVEAGLRDQVTLLGSGGIVAAEHVPKAILAGLDAVALDTPLMIALQAFPEGRARNRGEARFELPPFLAAGGGKGRRGDPGDGAAEDWAVQRLENLAAAWRDQLLEILGAMGLREVRRLRGELGRAMFQHDLEAEAFGDIEGFSTEGERA